ncbi:helix-turn-helix transcriptional regulator [Phenylobacterium sp.]|uniref:helix-turn-helix transcriptional regulator n=1 Tax=Phenylobacterium sp. TaxID=1871053 RepID=UPI002B656DD5|nr:helix-turn-helix transcriptional regulator [Phenylobacterium sp.]HLZ73877.1 helix-turn-helix transcriptional regulator [Phenylobacterium sp.]
MGAVSADPIDVGVGARIRARRLALRMSQSTLAEHLGVSFQQVQKYERGANRISASMLIKAARALNCPGSFLLGARGSNGDGDGEALAPQEKALEAEIKGLLATPGAEELLRAFGQLPAGEARASVIAIVSGLASGSYVRRG